MMILRFPWLDAAMENASTAAKTQIPPNFILHLRLRETRRTLPAGLCPAGQVDTCLYVCMNYFCPDRRPISRSKNLGESTSTATLALATNLSRKTGEVRVLARVGA